jgi:hypothetical protein
MQRHNFLQGKGGPQLVGLPPKKSASDEERAQFKSAEARMNTFLTSMQARKSLSTCPYLFFWTGLQRVHQAFSVKSLFFMFAQRAHTHTYTHIHITCLHASPCVFEDGSNKICNTITCAGGRSFVMVETDPR